ncbi:MAG: ABC transporter ATP-binding protein [Eubacterium sp.]|nr:ABC transporter ATP-binding protein [Eubacterium sp.]
MRLNIENVTYSYGKKNDVDNVSLHVNIGEFVGIIGPNGSGKSTLLKNTYRALRPNQGQILLDGENLHGMSYKKSARKIAVVGQENDMAYDFSVEEIVAMGRSPHKGLFDFDNKHDKEIVSSALKQLGLDELADKNFLNLSGGEKQRTLIARALAQESDFFILDEPTNHLDISHQMQIFDFIKHLDVTVLSAIHDLNLAALYCDRIYVLKDGKVILEGAPEEVLTEENIYNIYGVRSCVAKHHVTGKTSITFLPSEDKKVYRPRKGERHEKKTYSPAYRHPRPVYNNSMCSSR